MAQPPAPAKEWNGGTLLFAGGTDWARLGRSIAKKAKAKGKDEDEGREEMFPNLLQPTRFKVFAGIKIQFVAAGPAAVHCLAADVDGNLYTWGRNERGQLGHGDFINRNNPKLVEDLKGKHVIAAAGGRHHSLVCTKDGEAWSFGLNAQGQLGIGHIKKGTGKGNEDVQLKPVKTPLEGASACSAGIDFSMWIAGGRLWSAGSPQYGQTGDGSDHSYNAKDASISIVYEPQPTPKKLPSLADKTITRVACGHNHTICVDDQGHAYTWGFGGYGRLGHRIQKDEFEPRPVEEITKGRVSVPADAVVAAGSVSTFCTVKASNGQQSQVMLYVWGKLKTNGDGQMYPILLNDMCGWNVRCASCGPQHFAIAADKSAITWGFATNGELAYGPNGKKSSANAAKVNYLDDTYTHQVAAGVGFTMFLVEENAKVQGFPEFDSTAPETATHGEGDEEGEEEGAKGAGAVKRGKGAAAGPAAKKAKKK